MYQPARPAFGPVSVNAFPGAVGAVRATADPARPPVPARAVAAGVPQPGRPATGPRVPVQRPQPSQPPRPHLPQRPQANPQPPAAPQRPQAPPAAPQRPQIAQRPQVAPPLRPVQRAQAPRQAPQAPQKVPQAPQTPPRPYAPPPAAPRPATPAPAPTAASSQPEPLGPPPRPRKGRIGRWITLLVIVGGVGGAAWYATHTAPASAGVGDCLAQTGGNALTKVVCSDESARFHVIGKLENRTMVDASLDACKPFPKATSSYWEGESGQPGLVLCLEPVAAPAK